MSRGRHLRTLLIFLMCAQPLFSCEIITIGGPKPVPVRSVTGTVVGSGRYELMGMSRDKERRASVVRDATISLKKRKDIEVIVEGELPPDQKWLAGALAKWECGEEVATAKSDAAGKFALGKIPQGAYCLEVKGPPPRENEMAMGYSFVLNIADSAPEAVLTADISPRWPDCSGGESLTTKPMKKATGN